MRTFRKAEMSSYFIEFFCRTCEVPFSEYVGAEVAGEPDNYERSGGDHGPICLESAGDTRITVDPDTIPAKCPGCGAKMKIDEEWLINKIKEEL